MKTLFTAIINIDMRASSNFPPPPPFFSSILEVNFINAITPSLFSALRAAASLLIGEMRCLIWAHLFLNQFVYRFVIQVLQHSYFCLRMHQYYLHVACLGCKMCCLALHINSKFFTWKQNHKVNVRIWINLRKQGLWNLSSFLTVLLW
jgi:hypothetical protein